MENCEWCGKRFMSDCGDSFCSSSCENAFEKEHEEKCENCGDEVYKDGYCQDCWEDIYRETK
jgi:hypothetical protein